MSGINAGLHSEISVYTATLTLNGRAFQVWYAIADLSSGNIELKATLSATAQKPSQVIAASTCETTYVIWRILWWQLQWSKFL